MREPESPAGAPAEGGGILVGRDRELGLLLDALGSAESGHGCLVLLSGEAGIGKTRLSDAFGRIARERGANVLWGRCWEAGGAPAYWPWVQVIRAYLRSAEEANLRSALGSGGPDVARIVPELQERLPDLPALPPDESERARFAIFEATARFLCAVAAREPVVLILDDLHAADEPSLRLLQFLAADMADSHLLVLAVYREDELGPDDPRLSALADIARASVTRRVVPHGLTEADVALYLELVGAADAPDDLVAAIHRQTEGNPLFISEVVRLVGEEGRLDGSRLPAGRPFEIPQGVRAAIGRRLTRLSPDCHALLARASVFGVDVPVDLLARLEGVPVDALADLLEEGATARVLLEPAGRGTRRRFSHALIRDVLYASLPASARLRLHLQIGDTLEALHGADRDPPLAEMANHFVLAGSGPKAVEYARRAAERATELYAHEEAVRLYRLALAAGELEETERCHLLLALGEAAIRSGDQAGMREAFLEAADIAVRQGLPDELARAAVGYGGRLVHRRAGDDELLVPLLERALEALSPEDSILRVRLLARLGGALRDQPDMAPRDAVSAEGLAMARRLGDLVTLGFALLGRHAAIWGPDAMDEMIRLLDEVEEVAVASHDTERLAELPQHKLVLLRTTGASADVVQAELEAGIRATALVRQPALAWYSLQWQAVIALDSGRLDAAEELFQEVRRRGNRSLSWDADFSFRVGMILVRREQARLGEVAEEVRRVVVDFPGYRFLSCLSTYVDATTGREGSARRRLDELAQDGYAYLPRDLGWPIGMMYLGETAILLGDTDKAAEIQAALRFASGTFASASGSLPGGPVDRVLGILSAEMGHFDQALDDLERAARACASSGRRLWETRIAVERAGVLVQRGHEGDGSAARGLLATALETCRELGLAAIQAEAERVTAMLERRGAAAPAAGGPPVRHAASFRREGEYWAIDYGEVLRLRDSKGLRYLAVLLTNPGREFMALDLASGDSTPGTPTATAGETAAAGLSHEGFNTLGDVLDPEAKQAYRARLRELAGDLDEAEAFHDPERAALARMEIEALEAELAGAFGLGGRARQGGSPAERARQSVTKAIRDSLKRVAQQDPALGDHLARSIHTGLYCVYDPDPTAAPSWTF